MDKYFVQSAGCGAQGDLRFLESINSTSLELLAINIDNFGGTLPESIGNLSSQSKNNVDQVESIVWKYILSSIGNLRRLELLSMGNNKFTGSIPKTIGNLIELKEFHAQMNKLTGNIPSTIGGS